MDIILAGIQGLASFDDSAKINTLLAKLRFNHDDKILLENDIIIDFTSWNNSNSIIEKIKIIRSAIAKHELISMDYYSGSGFSRRCIEPYKLIFKQEYWYLFGYCTYRNDFRVFKVNRIGNLLLEGEIFRERKDYQIPLLQSDFPDQKGERITARIDKSLEFLAVDFFGLKNIVKDAEGNIIVSFFTKNIEWTISIFADRHFIYAGRISFSGYNLFEYVYVLSF